MNRRKATSQSGFVLGIDLGTSGLKCNLVDASGREVGEVSKGYPTHTPHDGWSEQDPQDWLTALEEALQVLLLESGLQGSNIACIGICSAAHIPVLLDDGNQPLRPAILWNDGRSTEEVDTLREHDDIDIRKKTGNQVSTTWTLPQLLWIARHEPEVIARTRSFLSSKDYLGFILTGSRFTDPTSAAATMLYDINTGQWDQDLLSLVKLSPDALPKILPSLSPSAEVSVPAAERFGLAPGTPVMGGMLDSAAELISAGALYPGQGLVRLGSAGGIMTVQESLTAVDGVLTYPHPNGQLGYRQAGTNSCALSIQWVKSLLESSGDCCHLSYSDLDALAAASTPGSQGLLFHPYLQGERAPYWEPFLRGSFIGARQGQSRADMVRAVFEGVSFSLLDCLEALPADGHNDALVLLGGGSKSHFWPQLLATILGHPLTLVENGNSTYGIALAAAVAAGFFPGLDQAVKSCVLPVRTLHPDPATAPLYAKLFTRYRRVKEALTPVYEAWDQS